ncbi:hypothetical protein C2S52_020424 [Perilla frutescens var. hirtella]|nr:hypothetical protein C2S52_020424 [Perilla frutescens var. hirtella]
MFPSSPNCNNPFESVLMKRSSPSFENPNPSSKLLFNFPSPFLDEHESPLNQIFLQTPQLIPSPDPAPAADHRSINIKFMEEQASPPPPLRRRSLGVIPRRRAGKKDRHSKICTAQGIRDRRMRLSLQVARKFFDLQDMLGYDKASKTIEWLFTQSNDAIKDLVHDHHSESFISECEDINEEITSINSNVANANEINSKPPPSCKRESREKARARARCRTREKMLVKCFQFSGNPSSNNIKLQEAGGGEDEEPANPNIDIQEIRFEAEAEAEAADNYNTMTMEQQLSDVGTIEKFLGNSTSDDYHCTSVSDYADPNSSSFMGFLGNWDHDRTTNCFQYSVTNQLSFAGNLNSVFSATADFP